MVRSRRVKIALVGLLAAASLAGCQDDARKCATGSCDGDRAQSPASELATAGSSVVVRTRFVIEGLGEVADEVDVERLFLNVGTLLLEPVDTEHGAAYASRDPFQLDFQTGVARLDGPVMVIPRRGTYAVSLQIEPGMFFGTDGEAAEASLEVVGELIPHVVLAEDKASFGDPMPLPRRPDEKFARLAPSGDAPPSRFRYRSDRNARLALAEIDLTSFGEYEVVLKLRVGDWMRDSLLPELRDGEHRVEVWRPVSESDRDRAESRILDKRGLFAEALIGDIAVDALPMR